MKTEIKKKKITSGVKVKTIAYIFVVVSLIVVSVFNYSKLNELSFEVSIMENQNDLLEDDIVRMNVELNKKTDISGIEEKAEELGMRKTNQSSVKYICVPSENTVESNTDENDSIFTVIAKSLSIIMEYFS